MAATDFDAYFPFDAGAGGSVAEASWRKMARLWVGTGPIRGEDNGLAVYADTTGMQVKIRSGKVWVRGHYAENSAETILPIAAANGSNPRIDRVVVRADFTANKIQLDVLTGTPAGSPAAPSLTQSSTIWEISLAQVAVPAADTTIDAGQITDERGYAVSADELLRPPRFRVKRTAVQTIANATHTALSFTAEDKDTHNGHDNSVNPSRYTIPADWGGDWMFGQELIWATNLTGIRWVYFQVNGDTARRYSGQLAQAAAVGNVQSSVTLIPDLVPDDYVEVYVDQTSAGSLDVNAVAEYSPRFWGRWLAPLR